MPTNFDINKHCNNVRQCSTMSFTKKATQTNNARSTQKMRFAQRARLMALYR
jgi:hypothetical protein